MATTKETPISLAVKVPEDVSREEYKAMTRFLNNVGVAHKIEPEHDAKDSFSHLAGGVLKVISVGRGKVSCSLDVKPPNMNVYGGMHGGSVAAVACRVANACARTIIGKDREIFLSELSMSYLSVALENIPVVVDGTVIKMGRNLITVAVNFRHKECGRLLYTTHATFYNMPVSSL